MTDKNKNIEFGIILSLVLFIISVYCQITLTIPIIMALAVSVLIPEIYTPFAWCWIRLGDLLSLVVTYCILFLLFFWNNYTDRNASPPDEKRYISSERIWQKFRQYIHQTEEVQRSGFI